MNEPSRNVEFHQPECLKCMLMRVHIFGGGISIFWSCLVELNEKNTKFSQIILPMNSKMTSQISIFFC